MKLRGRRRMNGPKYCETIMIHSDVVATVTGQSLKIESELWHV